MENDVPHAPDLIDAAHDAASRVMPSERERLDDLAVRARTVDQQIRRFVREYPTATVLGALALGFLVGRLLRR